MLTARVFFLVSLPLLVAACTSTHDGLTSSDELSRPESACGFEVSSGTYEDTDGDGQVDSMGTVDVRTTPQIRLLSPTTVTVGPHQDVILTIEVSSYAACGALEIDEFFFGVYDYADGSDEWLKALNDDGIPSYLTDQTTGAALGGYAAENMYVTPTGDQLFYVWKDAKSNDAYGTVMPTQEVSATGRKVYQL